MIYTLVDFDGQHAADHTLLIRIGLHENALAVLDDEQQLKFATTYNPLQVEKTIQDILGLGFGTVKMAVSDSRYTFVPADVFDEAYMQTYVRYLPGDGVAKPVLADIRPLNIKLLHQTSRIGVEAMEARFPQLYSCPTVQTLLYGIANHDRSLNEPLLFIDKHSLRITICLFDAQKLIYSNDFEIDHPDNLAYYLLTVLSHLGLGDKAPLLCLSGDIEEGDPYYERASTYGRRVVLADSGALTGVGVPMDFVAHQHRFLTLFGLNLCG
jgi:hypothetical protein